MKRYDQCDETCTVDCGHCKGNHEAAFEPRDLNVLADQVELIKARMLAEERVILSRRERHALKRPVTRKAKR